MADEETIDVTVNTKPVTLTQRKQSGLRIKEAAIAQGVGIQLDFSLYIIEGNSPLKPVADSDTIEVHNKEAFKAVAPDDTSQ